MKEQNIDLLCEKRKSLIMALEQGELNKEGFIKENFKMIQAIKRVDMYVTTPEEGIIKYHYFNTMAKMKMMDADVYEYRSPEIYRKYQDEAHQFYHKKEQITHGLLELLEFKGVSAYFINMKSHHLRGTVFEIVIDDFDYGILHSKDRKILNKLKLSGCFCEEQRDSLIDQYVNTKL